ncbi:MAG: hypothetical protein HXY40_14155, partial [Chloroflexi bacterium]|nr:hypothetical protein [Chloroflexota bacterium]
ATAPRDDHDDQSDGDSQSDDHDDQSDGDSQSDDHDDQSGADSQSDDHDDQSGGGTTGEVWRDDGSCNNPPPDWAPAVGWRQRCQGQGTPPGHTDNPGRGMGN